jgi:MOSC domain-containing protein YiiM
MRIVSVNVGTPREIDWAEKRTLTSIFKTPVAGRVAVRAHNLEGDRQSDLTVHGGPDKAVYCYPSEHYAYWRGELPDANLDFGAFGENLTTEGLDDGEISIGDIVRAGSSLLMVTQPRIPCFKLAARFGRADMVKRFALARRPGFYFAVVEEGEVGAGDTVEVGERATERMSVRELFDAYFAKSPDLRLLRRSLLLRGLAEVWRAEISRTLAEAGLEDPAAPSARVSPPRRSPDNP